MRGMRLQAPGNPLVLTAEATPALGMGQAACGVCHTDHHVGDGVLPQATYPVVPGHETVGVAEELGPGAASLSIGDQVGVPWLDQAGARWRPRFPGRGRRGQGGGPCAAICAGTGCRPSAGHRAGRSRAHALSGAGLGSVSKRDH